MTLTVPAGAEAEMDLGLGAVAEVALTFSLLGWPAAAVLKSRNATPRKTWLAAAIGVLVVSFALAPPLTVASRSRPR